MSIVVDAVYQDGILKFADPLPLKDNERVKVTIEQTPAERVPLAEPRGTFTYGLLGWTGDPEIPRRIALDPEFGLEESP